jgi:hypothetical protein
LEFGQELVPGREFEIRDMFINGAGVVTVVVIGILIRRIVPVCGQQQLKLPVRALRASPKAQARRVRAYCWSPESARRLSSALTA